ncbi:MAG: hypothetical protein HY551_00275 [Elusimicrobia bacterium]|nr:hypothetical protein [Elusimicrobiota bacterium]
MGSGPLTRRRAYPFLMASIGLCLFLQGHLSTPAVAVFIKNEMDTVDPERLFDSRYFLDLFSFSFPLQWRWEDLVSPQIYRINAASLDRSDLLILQEVRIARPLAKRPDGDGAPPWLNFRYDLRQNEDKDLQEFHQWISLEVGPWRGFSLGVFGEPTFSKENADIGFLLRHAPKPGLDLYASVDFVDWNFNERGKTVQRYERLPVTYEGGVRYGSGSDIWKLSLEYDSPLVRTDTAQNLSYSYRKTTLAARWDRIPGDRSSLGISAHYRYEFKREANHFNPDPSFLTSDFQRNTHRLGLATSVPLTPKDDLEIGSFYLLRQARADAPQDTTTVRYTRWELQPYGRWRRALKSWMISEVALFSSGGENRQFYRSPALTRISQSNLLAKLGLGIDFLTFSKGRIGVYGTFDLDRADRHLWGGGNIRAQWPF